MEVNLNEGYRDHIKAYLFLPMIGQYILDEVFGGSKSHFDFDDEDGLEVPDFLK